MKRNLLVVATTLLMLLSTSVQATLSGDTEDTDVRMIGAKVVEVAEGHISIIARSGVEHVIAVDRQGTKVTIDGEVVSLRDLREGDIVTVELDELKEVKFAKNISMRSAEIARVRR
jgi:hypothetical protein